MTFFEKHRSWPLIGAVMLIAGLMVNDCQAISVRPDRPIASYNSLAMEFPATGYFGSTSFGQFCTGTLVAPNKVLTAAHCVDGSASGTLDDPLNELVFGLGANVPGSLTANVSSVAINPGWISSNGSETFDLAVLTLTEPITGVAPAQIYGGDVSGSMGYLVGYGTQGTGDFFPGAVPGANDKLAAQNIIDDTDPDFIGFDFDNPDGTRSTYGDAFALDLEGATASGDSGSPLYAQVGGQRLIVGVLNGGFNPFGFDSEYGDISIYAPLSNESNLNWLASQGITTAVPEPGSAALLAGLFAAVLVRRRR